jgi:hypothetical protein
VVAEVQELARQHTTDAVENARVDNDQSQSCSSGPESLLQTRYSTEAMVSRHSTSLVKVVLLTSYACRSHARRLRSG